MKEVSLRAIDETNYTEAFALQLAKGQEAFVSHPIRSLAQAYVYREQCQPFGIYREDVMVGYVMVIYDWDVPEYDIWHMMVDEHHQGQGIGKEALKRCLEYIKEKPIGNSDRVALTCNESNIAAMQMYRSMGFEPTSARDGEEIELAMTLK